MNLLINTAAAYHSSRGVRRYFEQILPHLKADSLIRTTGNDPSALSRLSDALFRGRAGYICWSPSHRINVSARNHVVTVHDCINVEYRHAGPSRALLQFLTQQTFNNASRLVAISEATKRSVLRNYRLNEQKITVIRSPAVLPLAAHTTDLACITHSEDPFVLMVTNALSHKNGANAVRAFALSEAARAGLRLHVIGALDAEALSVCAQQGVRLTIETTISDAQLRRYYSECVMLLSVSLVEGHNLAVAEALSCGATVVCSDIEAHREFYKNYAVLVDPYVPEAMATGISQALTLPRGALAPVLVGTDDFARVAMEYNALFRELSAAL